MRLSPVVRLDLDARMIALKGGYEAVERGCVFPSKEAEPLPLAFEQAFDHLAYYNLQILVSGDDRVVHEAEIRTFPDRDAVELRVA